MVRPDHALVSLPSDLGDEMRTGVAKRPPDVFAAPAFAWVRVGVMASVAAGGLIASPSDSDSRLFFQLMTFGGLPISLLLLATLGRLSPRTHAYISATADLVAAVALHALHQDGGQVARLAYVVVPAIVAITAGFLPAFVFTVIGVAINAFVDYVDVDSVAGDFNPVVHVVRFGMASLLVYLVARATDERRRAQASEHAASAKAETILSKVSSAVVVTDANGRLLEWNEAAGGVMSSADEADEVDEGPRTCERALGLHAGGRPLDCSKGCGLLRLRHEYAEHDSPEITRVLPDGRKQPLVAEAAAITDTEGRTMEVVHSLIDVTRLKQADEAKTLFLATASHELKTPLTVIGGFAELMLSMPELPDEQRRDALETIRRRAAELGGIVDRLLLSSRIESGRVQVNLEAADIERLVRERVDSLFRATGRAFDVRVDGCIPKGYVDPSAVTAVVDHLLENAVRYSPGGERVDVSMKRSNDTIEVAVRDRGIGMDPQQQERCFERFWQAESTDVRRFGGTGIGLYIVKSLVHAMGGTITVSSKLGQGTTFTVGFPQAEEVALSDADDGAIVEGVRSS